MSRPFNLLNLCTSNLQDIADINVPNPNSSSSTMELEGVCRLTGSGGKAARARISDLRYCCVQPKGLCLRIAYTWLIRGHVRKASLRRHVDATTLSAHAQLRPWGVAGTATRRKKG